MDILPPKDVVTKVTGKTKKDGQSLFSLKSKSTINGAFYGGGIGFLYGQWKDKRVFVTTIIGALAGGFISNILTVKTDK